MLFCDVLLFSSVVFSKSPLHSWHYSHHIGYSSPPMLSLLALLCLSDALVIVPFLMYHDPRFSQHPHHGIWYLAHIWKCDTALSFDSIGLWMYGGIIGFGGCHPSRTLISIDPEILSTSLTWSVSFFSSTSVVQIVLQRWLCVLITPNLCVHRNPLSGSSSGLPRRHWRIYAIGWSHRWRFGWQSPQTTP